MASVKERRSHPELGKQMEKFKSQEYYIIDLDEDGKLSALEHLIYFKCRGINTSAEAESFTAIDTSQDGNIDIVEFVTSGARFFTSDNENCPSRLFYGPLA